MAAAAEIEADPQIRHVMKGQGGGRDAKPGAAVGPANPFDDVIDVEDQLTPPVTLCDVANIEQQGIDKVVVPGGRITCLRAAGHRPLPL
jgi:hypothetical protein